MGIVLYNLTHGIQDLGIQVNKETILMKTGICVHVEITLFFTKEASPNMC